jgi:hypothetical protein
MDSFALENYLKKLQMDSFTLENYSNKCPENPIVPMLFSIPFFSNGQLYILLNVQGERREREEDFLFEGGGSHMKKLRLLFL